MSEKILIVDDEAEITDLIEMYRVHSVANISLVQTVLFFRPDMENQSSLQQRF